MSALAIELLPGLRLANPVMAAAGTVGGGADFERLVPVERLGAVVVGPITRRRRSGLTATLTETPAGLVWSGGGASPGIEATLRADLPRWRRWGVPSVANVAGGAIDEMVEVVEALASAPGVAAIEVDTGCRDEATGRRFDASPALAAALTAALRGATDLPLIVKLWGGQADPVGLASAVGAAGADALSIVNAPAAIVIDVGRRAAVPGSPGARLSGPATRPLAVRLVYELAQARLGLPLIGAGGITCAEDALQFIMAGARAVQVGTATLVDPTTMVDVIDGLAAFLARERLDAIEDLVGAAL